MKHDKIILVVFFLMGNSDLWGGTEAFTMT